MSLRRPALAVLLLAPVLGEGLSTATPPLDLLLPWNLALFVALYGCGALLCRELARRHRFGVAGLMLLAAAYAVYEEALVDRFWFTPDYWDDTGIGSYSAVWGTNLLLATHLTVFHVVVSIGASILVVERLFPERRDTAWAGPRGLVAATLAFLVVVPLLYGEYDLDPLPQLVCAAALMAALVALAFGSPRAGGGSRVPRDVRGAGWIASACAGTHFVLVYAVPSTGLPWPVGLIVSLAPVALGALLLRGADALSIVTGVLGFLCLLCVAIGLLGRYDTSLLGLLVAIGLWWLRRRARAATPLP